MKRKPERYKHLIWSNGLRFKNMNKSKELEKDFTKDKELMSKLNQVKDFFIALRNLKDGDMCCYEMKDHKDKQAREFTIIRIR